MSPAESWTISPTTISAMGISPVRGAASSSPRRRTVAVVRTIAFNASAALPERYSCQKRSNALSITIVTMMTTPV